MSALSDIGDVFLDIVHEHVEPLLGASPSERTLAQAKVLTLDKYFEWRHFVSPKHRGTGGKGGHICIFHIFEQAYEKIKQAELALAPPKVVESLPPKVLEVKTESPPVSLMQVPALFLGEKE